MKDDKKFYTWLRSGLRKLSRRWPAVFEALADAKVPYVGENKRKKWLYLCADCKELYDMKEVAVDHIKPAGILMSKEDIGEFVTNLFCSKDNLQVLCKECHDLKTYAERYNITKEMAIIEKKIIAFKKLSVKEQKRILTELDFKEPQMKNAISRAACYRTHLQLPTQERK